MLFTKTVVFLNDAYTQVLGGSTDQVQTELPALLSRLHPEDRAYLAHYWHMWVRGQIFDEVEVRVQYADATDQYQCFCLTPSYWRAADGRVLVGGTLRDISATKAHQANTDRFNARKNATLEILAHDLAGSFAMVQQIGDYLSQEIQAPAGSRVPEMLQVLETTSRNSVKMIRDLIAIEFLESTNTDLQCSRVDVAAVLREPLNQLQQRQKLLGYHFTYALPPDSVYAYLDVNKFTQVLINLVSNALKFTPEEGQVNVAVESCPGCIRFHVQDTVWAFRPTCCHTYSSDSLRPGARGYVASPLPA